ncbi:MAG: alkaline phosphatase family protein [Promethearchaeia archaeon]
MSRNPKVNQVILIILDDVRASHLFTLIDQNKLPNISKLAKSGISCSNCITSFPSITYPCYSNIVLGSYSGYYPKEGSGIPMYHWIAREDPPTKSKKYPIIKSYGSARHIRKINKDVGTNVKTIFEQAGGGNFASSLNLVNRGSLFIPVKQFTSASIMKGVEKVFENPLDFFLEKEVPKVTVAYIPETDDLMHNKGFDHPDYIKEIINCDGYLGSLIRTLKDIGLYDSTAIGIISDHGNYKTEKMYDIEPFFKEIGLTQYEPKNGTGDFDATMGAVGFFNFPGEDWHHHPTLERLRQYKLINNKTVNLIEILWRIPGVKLMYYRDNENTPEKGIIHIEYRENKTAKLNRGRIEYEGHGKQQKTKYIFENEEIYGYKNCEDSAKLLDNRVHTIEEWLEGTSKIDFPMIVDQIPRYFKNPRSCDVMISTIGEYGFSYEHGKSVEAHQYSHDIGLKKSMTVPFIVGGSPEIPKTKLKYCKTTDMVPTLLDLLGLKPHYSVVGKSVLNY